MNSIALDDEPIALEILAAYAKRIGDFHLECHTDPIRGMAAIRKQKPDLVFLDIEMGGIKGVELAKNLPEGTLFVFTTAYAHYALTGFELDAADFLHKPFSFERFEKAVKKVRTLQKTVNPARRASPNRDTEYITVKSEYRNVRIGLAHITYIEAMDNYVRIHLDNGRTVLPQTRMKNICEILPEKDFVRIHKSYVVPVSNIRNYNRSQVRLYLPDKDIPVGRTYSDAFAERMQSR